MPHELVLETSRPRHGKRFEPVRELALLEPAIEVCHSLPNASKGLLVVREMSGPLGIPDLTALVANQTYLERRLSLDIPPILNQIDAFIVASASPKISRSKLALAQSLQWSEETIARRLPMLLRSGALREVRPGRYTRHEALIPLGRLYAVETKISDWSGALHQVRSYSVWADSYVLVMGSLAERSLSQLVPRVEKDKGGLVVDGQWIRRPVIHQLSNPRRFWAAEHFVAAVKKR